MVKLLRQCITRPTHILPNKIPLYQGEDFVTAQNIREGSYSPLHVYSKKRFVRSMEQLGYTLGDLWVVNERWMHIPRHPERSFPFTGLYFVGRRHRGSW